MPATSAVKSDVPVLFGPYGSSALKHIGKFADYGANALWFHGFSTKAFEACEKHRIAPCVELRTFRADFNKHPELIPIGVDGKPIRYGRLVQGVCLSKRDFLAAIEAELGTSLGEFKPAGVWLDYLTYAGWFEVPDPDLQESCFCKDCIADFCEHASVDATTPEEILRSHAPEWTKHKCKRIAEFAARYAGMIRSKLPECIVGAYMCPWTPDEFGGALQRIFGQDYRLLSPAIDVFTPLIYAKKSGRSPEWGREFLERAPSFVPGHRKVQLILDVLDFPDSLEATAASWQPSWGLQLYGGAQVFADPMLAKTFGKAVDRIRATIASVSK